MKKWGHDELQEDLAAHLRGSRDRVVWTNMQLGPSGSPRPDVYTIPKSFSRFTPLAYEIKISTSDFRRDITSGKWQSYLQFAAGVIFAVPAGLIKKEDVPPGCGLIVRHDEVWRTVKGPTLKATDNLPRDAWIKLMIDGLDRQGHDPKPRNLDQWAVQNTIRKKHGDLIGNALRDLSTAEYYLMMEKLKTEQSTEALRTAEQDRIKHIRANVEKELEAARNGKAELCRMLGLPDTASAYQMQSAVSEFTDRLSADGELQRLRRAFKKVEHAMADGNKPMPAINTDGAPVPAPEDKHQHGEFDAL